MYAFGAAIQVCAIRSGKAHMIVQMVVYVRNCANPLGGGWILLPQFATRFPRRLSHAGVAVILVTVTVVLVAQSTAGVAAVTRSVASLLAGPIRVPPQKCLVGSNHAPHRRALVLFDDSGGYAAYAARTADLAANFVSHFARPVLEPVTRYHRGEMAHYAAIVYVGTTSGEPLPRGFLSDMRRGKRPVLWLGGNISELTNRRFARAHGWRTGADRPGRYTSVTYRRVHLVDSGDGLTGIDILNPAKAVVLATAISAGRKRTPWAVRSGALTYVAEAALDDGNGSGFDRSFAVADMDGEDIRPDAASAPDAGPAGRCGPRYRSDAASPDCRSAER